jgi:hypothetical protein
MKTPILISAFFILWTSNYSTLKKNNKTIQFDITKTLNARPVTTLTNGKLITWTEGIDGDGAGDGYLTMSAALFNGDKDPHALPDNPLFAANKEHPEIKLHYSNGNSAYNQACSVSGAGSVQFTVPNARYKDIYLALTSAEGPSALSITLTYADNSEVKDFTLPDYYMDLKPGDPDLCYLAHDLAKWGNKNNMTEKDHHNIDLLNIHPDPKRELKSIHISKSKPGYMVFWAATGVKAD